MSVAYQPVGWTRFKWQYDAVLVGAVLAYLLIYRHFATGRDSQTVAMDAFGSCAFLLLTIALCIGPLTRLDRRLLPLLYNRRHLGVLTALVATAHAQAVLGWYFAYSPTPALRALFTADTGSGLWHGIPFIPFGMFALLALWVLAATSHDFWLAFLTPPVWKALHLGIYAAYAALVLHLGLGALQDSGSQGLAGLAMLSVVCVCGLHVAASGRTVAPDTAGWIAAGRPDELTEDRARIVPLGGGRSVAVFRHGGKFAAVANQCAHQNGPLGEGRVVDGCVVCPWHGYQYRLEDGCSPPPFTERVATHRLRLDGGVLFVDPAPQPLGAVTEPLAP